MDAPGAEGSHDGLIFMPMSDLKSAALELAKDGIEVFPLGGDKKPRTTHGFHDATTDSSIIERWNWNGDGAIGAAIPEGHFIVDIDPRNGGDRTIKALLEAGMLLPATKVVTTKSGGSHRYYKLPEGLVGRRLRGTLGPGVDIKAAGKGYVVVPPSPGYEVKFSKDPAEAPKWMLDEIVAPEVEVNTNSNGGPPKFFDRFEKGTAYGVSALEKELGRLASAVEGERNNTLNRSAFAMAQLVAGGEISEEECLRRLHHVGVQIGLDEREVHATITSGWQSGMEQPRESPNREDKGTPLAPNAGSATTSGVSLLDAPELDDDGFYWLDWQIDEPPPPFYLHPIIPKNSYIIVYGATESSKSMVFLALAVHGSHRDIKTSMYSLENPSHIDRDRVRRLGPDPDHFRITNQPIDINDARQVMDLIERNRAGGKGSWPDGEGTDWLIIDTYSHAFNSRSEDGNAKAIEFARRIRYIMHHVGCTVILIDHTGYEQNGEPRDASAKRQQVDVAIFMEKVGKWAPGAPARFSMDNRKSARFGNPFFLRGEILDVRPADRGLDLKWLCGPGEQPVWE